MTNEIENVKKSAPAKKNKALPYIILGAVLVVAIIFCAALLPKLLEKDVEEIDLFHENLVCFTDGDEWGYANKKGKIVIKPKFAEAYAFADNGLALVSKDGENYGYINKKGAFVIKDKYKAATGFYDCGIAVVMNEDGEVGAIDKNGETVIDFKYSYIGAFNEDGLAKVGKYIEKEDAVQYGVINSKGEIVMTIKYEDIQLPNKSGATVAKKDGSWGVVSKKGEWLVKPRYVAATAFDEYNLSIVVNEEGEYGLVNTKGKIVLKPKYEEIRPFSEDDGLAFFKQDGEYGVINTKGKEVVSPDYDGVVVDYVDGVAIVRDGDDYLVIDKKGDDVFEFDDCAPTRGGFAENGLICVQEIKKDGSLGKFGFLDKNGEPVVDFEYYSADAFYFGDFALVADDQYYGFIDKSGKEVVSLDYDKGLVFFSDNFGVLYEEDDGETTCVIVNSKGKVVFSKCENVQWSEGYKAVYSAN